MSKITAPCDSDSAIVKNGKRNINIFIIQETFNLYSKSECIKDSIPCNVAFAEKKSNKKLLHTQTGSLG
jgi:hypothetical protein